MNKNQTEKYRNKPLGEFPDVLTAEMIAGYLDIGYSKALNLIKYGGLVHKQIGNVYRVPKRYFEEWLNDDTIQKINLQ